MRLNASSLLLLLIPLTHGISKDLIPRRSTKGDTGSGLDPWRSTKGSADSGPDPRRSTKGDTGTGACIEIKPRPLCDWNDQQECRKEKDSKGCDTGTYCYPKSVYGCNLYCPEFCGVNELFCPGLHDETGQRCPTRDVCKAKNDPITGCPNHCEPHCAADEKVCPGVRTDPCPPAAVCTKIADSCPEQTMDENECTLIKDEPEDCSGEGEILCPGGFDTKDCRLPNQCLVPNTPEGCPKHCPPACHEQYQQACPTTYDKSGCPNPSKCKTFKNQCPKSLYDSNGCPLLSEPECPDNEMVCKKDLAYKKVLVDDDEVRNPDTICDGGWTCVPRTMPGKEGCSAYCPNGCVVQDTVNQVLVTKTSCEGLYDDDGCKGAPQCVENGTTCPAQNFDNNGCRIHPKKDCAANEIKCDAIFDQNGCKGEHQCIPDDSACKCPEQENDSSGCPLNVPTPNCGPTEISCSKAPDSRGCSTGSECLPSTLEGGCSNTCPRYDCGNGKISCPKYSDSGCIFTYQCHIATTEDGCQYQCNPYCDTGNGYEQCDTFDSQGCPLKSCKQPEFCESEYDDNGCVVVEPTICPGGERICDGGVDQDGCPQADVCIPDEEPCPASCDPAIEMVCLKGTYGFHIFGEHCVNKTAHSHLWQNVECVTHCPASCDWQAQKVCHSGFHELTGCPLQDACKEKRDPCFLPRGGNLAKQE